MKIKFLLPFFCFLISACGEKDFSCNSEDAKAIIINYFRDVHPDAINEDFIEARDAVEYDVDNIQTVFHDPVTESYSCKAALIINTQQFKNNTANFAYETFPLNDKEKIGVNILGIVWGNHQIKNYISSLLREGTGITPIDRSKTRQEIKEEKAKQEEAERLAKKYDDLKETTEKIWKDHYIKYSLNAIESEVTRVIAETYFDGKIQNGSTKIGEDFNEAILFKDKPSAPDWAPRNKEEYDALKEKEAIRQQEEQKLRSQVFEMPDYPERLAEFILQNDEFYEFFRFFIAKGSSSVCDANESFNLEDYDLLKSSYDSDCRSVDYPELEEERIAITIKVLKKYNLLNNKNIKY